MLWILFAVAIGFLSWGAWPRPVKGGHGAGATKNVPVSPGAPGTTLRVATFNIHGCKGLDSRRDLSRTANDLAGIDIAALQEVHDSWRAPRQWLRLAGQVGMGALNSPARRRWFRPHRSNVLLTRHPPGRWSRLPLLDHAVLRSDCRNLTVVQINAPRPLWILFTHLNRREGRDEQLAQVMHMFLRYSPAVLLGDLNIRRDEPAIRDYLARGDITDALHATLDSDDAGRIDWILCRELTVRRGGIIASGASDHPLYWCDIIVE